MKMTHYYWKEKSKIIVQNAVMGHMGQKHTHSIEEFEEWKKEIPKEHLVNLDSEK